MEASGKPARFSILMFPWLAHGHISPFLELSISILKRKSFQIYFCSTAINFSSIKHFIDKNELNDSVQLVQLHLSESELPPHYHTTKNLPPDLIPTLINAFQASHSSFSEIVESLIPDLVIYDIFQPWAGKIAAKKSIPAVYFSTNGAAFASFVHHQYTFGKKDDFPFQALRFQDGELKTLEDLIAFLYENIYDVNQEFLFGNFKESCGLVLVKTSRGIEEKYIDYLSELSHKKILPVGPLVIKSNMGDSDLDLHSNSDIIKWLNEKPPSSTVFISFGSENFLSSEEIQEIAKGVEISKVNFIWIIRFPARATVTLEDVLPQGFADRVQERGKILTGWAPQTDILAHPSIGGFLSHCGWSSVMESMYFGVPIIAMLMKYDQLINARMLVEAGSCVKVPQNENEWFTGEKIAAAMRKVVGEEEGERMRRRARELSKKLKIEEGLVLDEVAEKLWEMCSKHIESHMK